MLPEDDRPAAAFYVHPTGFFGCGTHWNEPRPWAASDLQTELMMHTQASAFNVSCRVYAPHYRQATLGSYLYQSSGRQALELAYSDVKQALAHFLDKEPTAPLVLASHSQGGHHLVRLLAECVEPDKQLQQRLVAVYIIGSTIPLDAFSRCFPSLHPSTGPVDTPLAVIAWDTKAEPLAAQGSNWKDLAPYLPGTYYSPIAGSPGWEVTKPPFLNTNPLTWKSNEIGERVSAGWLGYTSIPVREGGEPWAVSKFLADNLLDLDVQSMKHAQHGSKTAVEFYAESQEHCLCVPQLSREEQGLVFEMTKRGDYHILDYNLFYYNIRMNVEQRVAAFKAAI